MSPENGHSTPGEMRGRNFVGPYVGYTVLQSRGEQKGVPWAVLNVEGLRRTGEPYWAGFRFRMDNAEVLQQCQALKPGEFVQVWFSTSARVYQARADVTDWVESVEPFAPSAKLSSVSRVSA